MPAALAATIFVADRDSSQWVGPGLLGFVVILALGVGTYLLWRNMNKQIRKVDFDDGSETKEPQEPQQAKEPENGDQPAGSSDSR